MPLLIILGLLSLLTGCHVAQNQEEPIVLPISSNNEYLDVRLLAVEQNSDDQFLIEADIQLLNHNLDLEKDFIFTSLIEKGPSNDSEKVDISSNEQAFNEDSQTLALSILTEPITDQEQLYLKVIATPSYYDYELTFNYRDGKFESKVMNELVIEQFTINNQLLTLQANDIHPIKGLDLAIKLNNERIYPVFTTTEYDADGFQMDGQYEFATELPKSFDLILRRNQLNQIEWTFTLQIPIK
ncbi:hypothetical protein BTS2_0918 [Bacillus sp. TS-2]|nr:hypothetical protein BTS2_0918 [Bacillus sp. TS-2]